MITEYYLAETADTGKKSKAELLGGLRNWGMKSKYRTIGELVIRVDERNSKKETDMLLGVSIDKCFIPSVANTIGTDLTKYKLIRKDDFAVSLMQVSRDSKIPIARQTEYEIAMMSPAYPIFRVKNTNEILPEYLEMWFKRAEFDREAAFIAVGGVRGSMSWDEFAQMKVYVPEMEKQRKIVEVYKIVEGRIKVKRKINDNLPPHQGLKACRYVVCGGNEETAKPFSSLRTA